MSARRQQQKSEKAKNQQKRFDEKKLEERESQKKKLEELKEKVHPTDSTAVAAILFTKGKSYFEFVENSHFILITEVETKIKIYKK